MGSPVVSIIVPAYRAARFLPRMIASVRAQTFTDWELIIVDSRSDDGSREIVEGARRELDGRLVFIECDHLGPGHARNVGIDASRGEFIALLDADDEFRPTKLERQLELFKLRPQLGLVYSDYAFVDLAGQRRESVFDTLQPIARQVPFDEIAPRLCVCTGDMFEHLVRGYFIATIVGMVRRSVLGTAIRFLPQLRYVEEWVFYLDIARNCEAGFVNEPLSMHHFVAGSLSRSSSEANDRGLIEALALMRRRYRGASRSARAALRRNHANAIQQVAMHEYNQGAYARAARHFAQGFLAKPNLRTAIHLCQSTARSLNPKKTTPDPLNIS